MRSLGIMKLTLVLALSIAAWADADGDMVQEWVGKLAVDSMKAADEVAAKAGLINMGEVIAGSGIFHFKSDGRTKRSSDNKNSDPLDKLDGVLESYQLHALKRVKRDFLDEGENSEREFSKQDRCFISTLEQFEKPSRRCVFPFIYQGKVYETCTIAGRADPIQWCATSVTREGEAIPGEWGDCDLDNMICSTTISEAVSAESDDLSPDAGLFSAEDNSEELLADQELPVDDLVDREIPKLATSLKQRPLPTNIKSLPPLGPPHPLVLRPHQGNSAPPRKSVDTFASGNISPPFLRPPVEDLLKLVRPDERFNVPAGFLPPISAPRPPSRPSFPSTFDDILQLLRSRPAFSRPPTVVETNRDYQNEDPDALNKDDVMINDIDTDDNDVLERFTDKEWPRQWYLNRGNGLDMNVEDAWDMGYTGAGVTVTILDDGVEWDHPDLRDNYAQEASFDINANDKDPFPRYDLFDTNKHGTRCAGQVAAMANNSLCSVGIAFNAGIGGVRMLDGTITDAVEARSLSLNPQSIDIYSASWGPDDDGRTVDGPGPLTRRAIEEGVKRGRNGLGSIFIWASGNGGKFQDNCNCDGYATSIYTLSVSSASENGRIPWYSEQCSSTLATTYSSGSTREGERKVVTTDLHARCTSSHTGTSASSPMAAGIIALVLEANPDLTWRDLQHITVRTAKRSNLKATDWSRNGAGLEFSHAFGFGLMDAGAMVKMALNWTTVPQQVRCDAIWRGEIALQGGKDISLMIPFGDESDGLDRTCANLAVLEHVHVTLDLASSTRRGEFGLSLVSPMGTVSQLLAPRPLDTALSGFDNFRIWPLMSTHFWGEDPHGNWTLIVRNNGHSSAFIKEWKIILYGTTEEHNL